MKNVLHKLKKYILFVSDKILSFYKLHAWAGLFIRTSGFMLWLRIEEGMSWDDFGDRIKNTDILI